MSAITKQTLIRLLLMKQSGQCLLCLSDRQKDEHKEKKSPFDMLTNIKRYPSINCDNLVGAFYQDAAPLDWVVSHKFISELEVSYSCFTKFNYISHKYFSLGKLLHGKICNKQQIYCLFNIYS